MSFKRENVSFRFKIKHILIAILPNSSKRHFILSFRIDELRVKSIKILNISLHR